MKQFLLLFSLAISAVGLQAQIITTQPALIQQNTPDITLIYHADRGNKALEGLKPPTKVYAHTGVITNKSTGPSDWKHAPQWGDNSAKYELTWVSDNTWTLNIPSLESYYNLEAGETVTQLAFVFRASNGAEGKTEEGGDIFVEVAPEGFQAQLNAWPDGKVVTGDGTVTFTVNTTEPADIAIYVGSVDTAPIGTADGVTTLSTVHTFKASGTYDVIAVATAQGKTVRQSLQLMRLGASTAADFPGGVPHMGYTISPNGDVTFCIAAPKKENVVIVPSWDDYEILVSNQMYYQDYEGQRYFWITKSGLDPTGQYMYYYLVDGTRSVGDPYARLVLDPWNDRYIPASVYPDMPKFPTGKVPNVPLAVFSPAQDSYEWQVTDFQGPAPQDLMIYELLIRDFTGNEGQSRGNGTIAGVMEKLDYLQQMGINAVELLPIMEFNGNNSWGYNTNFYFAPDKAYGTPDDYRRLIDECHSRGMAVILDIVFNQSDGLHPWYQMYDIADNPFYNGSAPHAYSVLNDWNQDNPLVQQQWHDALAYWLTAYNVDGFRFDLVKGLGNNDSYGNTYYPATNTWGTPSDANTNRFNATRVARMKDLHDAMRAVKPEAYFINENLAGAQEENDMAKDGELNWANINDSSCQFAMGYQSNSGLNRFYAVNDSRLWGSTVSYAESHDEERMAYKQAKYGVEGVKGDIVASCRRLGSVAAQMLLSPGAHMIWQFQELGADQTTKDSNGGNDTSPKKVVWSLLKEPNHAGLQYNYGQLCRLRNENTEMFAQDVAVSMNLGANNWNNGRTIRLQKGNSAIVLFVNPNVTATVSIPSQFNGAEYDLMSCSYGTTPTLDNDGNVVLAPGAYAVYGTGPLVGIDNVTIDNDNPGAPVEYYNLQGIRLNRPEPGSICIMRQGATVSKVIFK